MSEKDQFYIGVKSPVEIRRQVLESSRSVLQTLQQYEKFKELRMQKLEEIAALKNILRELDNAVGMANFCISPSAFQRVSLKNVSRSEALLLADFLGSWGRVFFVM